MSKNNIFRLLQYTDSCKWKNALDQHFVQTFDNFEAVKISPKFTTVSYIADKNDLKKKSFELLTEFISQQNKIFCFAKKGKMFFTLPPCIVNAISSKAYMHLKFVQLSNNA